jgi:Fic family protein
MILKLISKIDLFKGEWNSIERKENKYLKELKRIATVQSIGSSTRIEGATLTDEEIQKLLQNLKITKLETRDEQEVVGYFDTLDIVFESFKEIKLSKSYLLQLHQLLLKYSTKDERHRGGYKNVPNKVVASYPDGKQKVVFDTTEPALVDFEMNDVINWANNQFETKDIHPLIIIAVFIYEFLSIHPFQDGNGRLSRILTTLLLLRNEYNFIQFISFENLIEQKKKTYYTALRDGQKNRSTGEEKIDKWIIFYLQSLETLIDRLKKKYDTYKSKGGYLNSRQKDIFEFIKTHQPTKLSEIANYFPSNSINTIKKDLQYLRNENHIESVGKNKGTFYLIYNSSKK